MSVFDSIASKVTGGIKKSLPPMSAIGMSVAGNLVGKFAPKGAAGPLMRALRGDVSGAIADGALGFLKGKLASALSKNQLLGGITIDEARRIHDEIQSTNYSKKNLFLLELRDSNPPSGNGDIAHLFNLFATDVSFGPQTITGETKNIGMAVMDVVTGTERVEMRITTYDDTAGTIKSWFEAKCAQVAHADGTAGVPFDYLIGINILQSATDEIGAALFGGHQSEYVMRPASMEIELSRSEDALQMLQMTFVEFDTFMYKGAK